LRIGGSRTPFLPAHSDLIPQSRTKGPPYFEVFKHGRVSPDRRLRMRATSLNVHRHARVIGLKVMETESAGGFRYANVWNSSAAVDVVENGALAVHRE